MNYLPNDEIPNGEVLFRYCNPSAFPDGQVEIPIALFMDSRRELSCDWKLFRPDPSTSFHIAEGKTRIIVINVCDAIRNPVNPQRSTQKIPEWHQTIIYSPIKAEDNDIHGENLAHSLIIGLKKAAICESFAANSSWFDFFN